MNILGITVALLACSQEEDLRIRPFLARHCFECHGEKAKKADLRLDTLSLGPRHLDSWAAVLEKIESGEMPPPKKPRPDQSEIKAVVEWIGGALHRSDAPGG